MRITLKLEDKGDWVKVFNPSDRTIFVAGDSPPKIGARLRVDLIIANGPKVIFRGKVIARRLQGDSNLPKGCSIALTSDEREKINYLNGYVRGGLLDLRETRRIPVRLKVAYNGASGPLDAYSRDINDEGIFVVTEEPLPENHALNLSISFPGASENFSVKGVVAHTVVVEDEDVPGMGIRFALNADRAKLLSKAVDELEALFLSGKLADNYLV